MLEVKLYPDSEIDDQKVSVVVVLPRFDNKWVICKPKGRNTFEFPGGHVDEGECSFIAAQRELFEETGATKFKLFPICTYLLRGDDGVNNYQEEIYGKIYYGEIKEIGNMPDFEMEKIVLTDNWDQQWTYPQLQTIFIDLIEKMQN